MTTVMVKMPMIADADGCKRMKSKAVKKPKMGYQ